MRSQASVDINRPVGFVFSFVDEPEKLKLWVSGLVETIRVTPGETRPGMKFRNVTQAANGKRSEAQGEILSFVPDKQIKYRVVDSVFDAVIEYQLQATATGTRIIQNIDIAPQSRFVRLIFTLINPIISGQTQKRLLTDLNKLKQVAEAN